MKLPIRFRGRFWNKDELDAYETDYKDGNFIYGGYARMKLIDSVGEGDYIISDRGIAWLVYPNSAKQLVGYDKDGREVYEGDALETDEGTVYASVLRHAKIAPCNDMEFSEMAERFGWKLKEVAENENDG